MIDHLRPTTQIFLTAFLGLIVFIERAATSKTSALMLDEIGLGACVLALVITAAAVRPIHCLCAGIVVVCILVMILVAMLVLKEVLEVALRAHNEFARHAAMEKRAGEHSGVAIETTGQAAATDAAAESKEETDLRELGLAASGTRAGSPRDTNDGSVDGATGGRSAADVNHVTVQLIRWHPCNSARVASNPLRREQHGPCGR